jgi:hypothetical protein
VGALRRTALVASFLSAQYFRNVALRSAAAVLVLLEVASVSLPCSSPRRCAAA